MSQALTTLSSVVGWIYFVAWSVSFYGQLYTNWRLKSVEGYKLDFQVLNITGFTFYSFIYIVGYFFESSNPFNNYGYGKVAIQDLLFALHALTIVLLTGIQCLIYPRGKNKVSGVVWGLLMFYWLTAPVLYLAFHSPGGFHEGQEFNFIMLLGYYKLSISVIKYIGPAYWNFKRKSTVGWSIENVLLDFTGGFFSIMQTIIDYANGTSGVINPIKFALGNISMLFDILFAVQHYILFKDSRQKQKIHSEDATEYKPFKDSADNSHLVNGNHA